MGSGSQWACNVLAAGGGWLQLHEELLDLDGPELVSVAESGMFPAVLAAPFDRMGWRYVRFHVAGRVAGSFVTHPPAAAGAALHEDEPLERPFTLHTPTTELEPAGAG